MMKLFVTSLLALTAALSAHAQDAAQKSECVDTARQLQKMMNPGDQLAEMQKSMSQGAPEELRPIVTQVVGEVMEPLMPKLEEQASVLMAKHFSCEELDKIKAFYETPEGQSMITKMPGFMADVGAFSQKEIMAAMPTIQKRVKELMDERKPHEPIHR
ncbi:MAG: DUF2059 domain-containing protein [Proteobacteria bacterium]|nr:DUF2059 domain-containing protein [Pseudomonadota bacterium]